MQGKLWIFTRECVRESLDLRSGGGQVGVYLAQLLLSKGYEVIGTSRDSSASRFEGLRRLGIHNQVENTSMAINDFRSVLHTVKRYAPDEISNLAGQSSVGLSFEQPVETMESIVGGTLNMLEVLRFADRPIRFYNAGSSECFGGTGDTPADESPPFLAAKSLSGSEINRSVVGSQLSGSLRSLRVHRYLVQP